MSKFFYLLYIINTHLNVWIKIRRLDIDLLSFFPKDEQNHINCNFIISLYLYLSLFEFNIRFYFVTEIIRIGISPSFKFTLY